MGKDSQKHLVGQSGEGSAVLNRFCAFDSTTVSLFSEVMKGVGRNPKGEGRKREED
jgi:hypothetical protein